MKSNQFIFIASQPRSGSTLLQNLLSNNDEVNTASEPWILLNFIHFYRPDLVTSKFDYALSLDAFNEFRSNHLDPDFDEKLKAFISTLYRPLLQDFKYVLDKTPRYYEILDQIQEMFPDAHIIVVKRNPLDVVRSMIKTWKIREISSLSKHYRDLIEAPFLLEDFCIKHKDNPWVQVVKYEDLIEKPESVVRQLYQWLNITFHPEVLDFKSNRKTKGSFGDPYLNKNEKDVIGRGSVQKLERKFEDFLSGYADFLSADFLREYGEYSCAEGRETRAFNYFLNLGENQKLRKYQEIKRDLFLRIQRIIYRF